MKKKSALSNEFRIVNRAKTDFLIIELTHTVLVFSNVFYYAHVIHIIIFIRHSCHTAGLTQTEKPVHCVLYSCVCTQVLLHTYVFLRILNVHMHIYLTVQSVFDFEEKKYLTLSMLYFEKVKAKYRVK